MIDLDEMQDLIRAANPVADPAALDPDELEHFVALARGGNATSARPDGRASEVELQTEQGRAPLRSRGFRRDYPDWSGRPRGLAVAFQIAATVLLVGAALLLLARGDRNDPTPPAITDPPAVDFGLRSTIQMTVDPESPLVVISTAVGDLEFVSLQYEPIGYHLNGEAEVTPHGLVTSEHGRLWWSTDFLSWQSVVPSVRPNGRVTVDGEDVIVHGRAASVRFAWDGAGWSEIAVHEVEGLEGSIGDGLEQIVFGSRGVAAVAGDTFFYSPNGVRFAPAAKSPSFDRVDRQGRCPEATYPFFRGERILATDGGFVTLTAGQAADREGFLCTPLLWTSVDGNSWELVAEVSPFGEAAVISDLAERNGRFIAVGFTADSEAALWVSDDGLSWEIKVLEFDVIDGVAAGDLGWVITGASPGHGELTMYFSPDGVTWDGPYARPAGFGSGWLPIELTVGPDFIVNVDAPALGRLQD